MTAATRLIPIGQARELGDAEALRALYEDFGVLADDAPTEPMPLELEALPADQWLARVRRILGSPAP